jgi:hypothetical protein
MSFFPDGCLKLKLRRGHAEGVTSRVTPPRLGLKIPSASCHQRRGAGPCNKLWRFCAQSRLVVRLGRHVRLKMMTAADLSSAGFSPVVLPLGLK